MSESLTGSEVRQAEAHWDSSDAEKKVGQRQDTSRGIVRPFSTES